MRQNAMYKKTSSVMHQTLDDSLCICDKDDRDGMGAGDEQTKHDASVDGFFMDRYEVTNAQYQQCVDAGGCEQSHYADGTCYHPVQQGDK